MKEITDQIEFDVWNKAVNTPKAVICDLQDVFARSNQSVLYQLFIDQDQNDAD